MADDLDGIKRAVAGYKKFSKEDGYHSVEVDYELKPIKLSLLQEIFDIDADEPDPGLRYLFRAHEINADQAKALQPYVIGGVIDLEKYDYMLECYVDE